LGRRAGVKLNVPRAIRVAHSDGRPWAEAASRGPFPGTPVVVRRRGALEELVDASGGGLAFENDDEAAGQVAALASDDPLRERLARAGDEAMRGVWSERAHLDAYLGLVERHGAAGRRMREALSA
jgi:glycosyltransferase involved in cell wall biosynthesis